MSSPGFSAVIAQLQSDETIHRIEFPANWSQGRAAFGGMVAALTARAAALQEGANGRPLRSLQIAFAAPLTEGEAAVRVQPLRAGKSVAQYGVQIEQNGDIAVQAQAVFGADRPTLSAAGDYRLQASARDSVPALPDAPGMPAFLRHFQVHWTGGGAPMSGRADRRLGIWARHLEEDVRFPAEQLVAIADVAPPLMLSHYTKLVKASSLTWSLQILRPQAMLEQPWFYLDYQLQSADNGYCQQTGQIFDANGQVCALTQQCMAYFE